PHPQRRAHVHPLSLLQGPLRLRHLARAVDRFGADAAEGHERPSADPGLRDAAPGDDGLDPHLVGDSGRAARCARLSRWCATARTANVGPPPLAFRPRRGGNRHGAGFTNVSVRRESSTPVTRTYSPKAGDAQREWLVIDA